MTVARRSRSKKVLHNVPKAWWSFLWSPCLRVSSYAAVGCFLRNHCNFTEEVSREVVFILQKVTFTERNIVTVTALTFSWKIVLSLIPCLPPPLCLSFFSAFPPPSLVTLGKRLHPLKPHQGKEGNNFNLIGLLVFNETNHAKCLA